MSDPLNLAYDGRQNFLKTTASKTLTKLEFAAGDCRRGQSLVVRAIAEGRKAAREIDRYLMEKTLAPGLNLKLYPI